MALPLIAAIRTGRSSWHSAISRITSKDSDLEESVPTYLAPRQLAGWAPFVKHLKTGPPECTVVVYGRRPARPALRESATTSTARSEDEPCRSVAVRLEPEQPSVEKN